MTLREAIQVLFESEALSPSNLTNTISEERSMVASFLFETDDRSVWLRCTGSCYGRTGPLFLQGLVNANHGERVEFAVGKQCSRELGTFGLIVGTGELSPGDLGRASVTNVQLQV